MKFRRRTRPLYEDGMMRIVPTSPRIFNGTIDELFDRYVAQVSPGVDDVGKFHRLFTNFLRKPDIGYVVRGKSIHRRVEIRTRLGLRILPSDNAPAWWVHHALWNRPGVDEDSFESALETCPRHFHDVSARRLNGISAAGWYVAHILPAKFGNSDPETWSEEEARMRFVRNLHPANHFYVPGGRSIGEDPRVIAYAARWSSQRYGSIWDEVLSWAGIEGNHYLSRLPKVTGEERVSIGMAEQVEVDAPTPRMSGPRGDPAGEIVEYRKSRLWFMADVIEHLGMDQTFRVVTPTGVFEMTRAEFYEHFPNVSASASYQIGRHYHYKNVPYKALRFLVQV
jgi:hypothetical protein